MSETEEGVTQDSAQSEQSIRSASEDFSTEQQRALVEALLFASGEPLSLEMLASITRLSEEQVGELLTSIKADCQDDNRGVELVEVAHKFQLRTKAVFSSYLRELKGGGPRRLSGQAMETLSIVAYRQPIVKSDIEKIRGVDATPTLKTLLERNLIKIVGHQASVGQPALYGTTDDFLNLFGLRSLEELPSLRDIQELESDPGESGEQDDAEIGEHSLTQEGEEIPEGLEASVS